MMILSSIVKRKPEKFSKRDYGLFTKEREGGWQLAPIYNTGILKTVERLSQINETSVYYPGFPYLAMMSFILKGL